MAPKEAWMSQVQFHTIVTHARPHLDEIFAIYILQTMGEEKFPGIKQVNIVPEGHGGEELLGCTAQELEKEGIICVGVGGGRFDEHPSANQARKEDESACTLVMSYLGLENNPALKEICKFVHERDLHASAHPFDLSRLVKDMHEAHPDDPAFVIKWAMDGLFAKHAKQVRFLKAQQECLADAQVEEINTSRGKVRMVTCVTDNEQFNAAARASGAGIIIQKTSIGNVKIFNNHKLELKMHDVARVIRLEEQYLAGSLVTTDWIALEQEGNVEGAKEWHFKEAGQGIMNGSKTHQDIPPTRIPLERIQYLVKIALDPNFFAEGRAHLCKKGICNSSQADPCPLYECGFKRCRKIQYEQNQR